MQIKACYHRPIDKVDMEVCFGYHQMPDTVKIDDSQVHVIFSGGQHRSRFLDACVMSHVSAAMVIEVENSISIIILRNLQVHVTGKIDSYQRPKSAASI